MRPLLCLLALVPLAAAGEKKEDGFVPLFNGADLKGWKQYDGKPGKWIVDKHLLVCTGDGGGWLGTERDYADFEVRLEYRLKPGGNSGVYIRAPEKGHISRAGIEIQVLDDDHPRYAKLNNYQYTGAVYHIVGPSQRVAKPAPEWNEMHIRAKGKHVAVVLNGKTIVDADLAKYLEDPAIAKEHTGLARNTGKIGLQSHTDRVEFRNIRIQEDK
jgi:hypothetical protein